MKGFFEHIKIKYNSNTCITLKHYCKQRKKLAKYKERLKFLLSCKEYEIIPTHLSGITSKITKNFTSDMIKNRFNKIQHTFLLKVLNLEIKQALIIIKATQKNIFHTDISMKAILNDSEYNTFVTRQTQVYMETVKQTQLTHSLKIKKLKLQHIRKLGLTFNESWFENKTNVEFPEESQWLLSLGKKFALPTNRKNVSPIHIIAEIEQYIQRIKDEKEKDIARTKIANRIATYKRTIKNTIKEKFILTTYKKTQNIIKRHRNEIIITDADKGNKTVVMYKEDYNNKMNKLLEDKSTYKTIRTDPTTKLQKINNNFVNSMFKSNYIDLGQKIKLSCSAATAPVLYGLPKIHKPDLPLRPIASSTNVPCYNLSRHIGGILKNIVSENYNIKNSMQLKEKIKEISLDDEDILVSFDAVSLFTNIPTHIATKIIMKQWETVQQHTKITKYLFLKILQFCLKDNNYFTYEKKLYNQTFGMPMGNPLSPTIANIVLDHLLDDTINKLKKSNKKIKFIAKYVDDIIAVVNKKDTDIILGTLNEYHQKLKFTVEVEENNALPFLDMQLFRQNNNINFNWYTKPMSSGRMINYLSTQPERYKINTAKNLVNKILDISDAQFHEENITKIRRILKKNNYPNAIINKLVNEKIYQLKQQKKGKNTEREKQDQLKTYYSITYIPHLTDKNLSKTINIDREKTTFAHKSNLTLNTIFTRKKPPIEKTQQSDVVYKIPCKGKQNEICNLVYIGTTKRKLAVRLSEHKADIKKIKTTTALSQHMIENDHKADFENVSILARERRTNTRYTLEGLHIQQNSKRVMNHKEDIDNISSIYSAAINTD